jgi:hypothetical protein
MHADITTSELNLQDYLFPRWFWRITQRAMPGAWTRIGFHIQLMQKHLLEIGAYVIY